MRQMILVTLIVLFGGGFTSEAAAQGVNIPGRLSGKRVELDKDSLLAKQLTGTRIISKGSVSQLSSRDVSLSDKKVKLKVLSDQLFGEQAKLKLELRGASDAIYGQIEEEDEAYETKEGYLIMRTTRMTVKDPAKASRRSALFKRNFGKQQGTIKLTQLKPQQKADLERIKNQELSKLPADHPLKLASQRGDQAILDALTSGIGEVEITDTAYVSKTPVLISKGKMQIAGAVNGKIDYSQLRPVDVYGPKIPDKAVVTSVLLPPSINTNGESSFKAEFVNGWTLGYDMNWERRYGIKYLGFFRVTLRAFAGVGLRVPIEVTGKLSPSRIDRTGPDDADEAYKVQLQARTLDGDKSYYTRAGMPNHLLFDGNEAFLTMGYGRGYKLHILGWDALYKPYTEESIGPRFDFIPPMSSSWKSLAEYFIPASLTRTEFSAGVLKGSVRLGVKLEARGRVLLKYMGYVWRGSQKLIALSSQSAGVNGMPNNGTTGHQVVTLDNPNQPKTVYSKITKHTQPGAASYGFEVGQLEYKADLALTPGVKLDLDLGYGSWTWGVDYTIWFEIFRVGIGQVQLGPHEGTKTKYETRPGIKNWRRERSTGGKA